MSLPVAVGAAGAASLAKYYVDFTKGRLSGNSATVAGYLFNWTTIPFIAVVNNVMDSRQPSQIDDVLIIGSQPSFWDVNNLMELGVKAVVNMCEEYSGPVETYKQRGIIQLRLPTTDHSEPTIDSIHKAIEFIEKHKKLGHKVFVHCRAGRGRSGAITFCWLVKTNPNMTLIEVQNALLEKRPSVRKTLYQQPNCMKYYESIKNNKL